MDKKPRLIDADALKKPLVEWLNWYSGPESVKGVVREIVESIDEAPTIEAEPVRHGRWIGTEFAYTWACSECGHTYYRPNPNYCPNCGANMDGGKENDRE